MSSERLIMSWKKRGTMARYALIALAVAAGVALEAPAELSAQGRERGRERAPSATVGIGISTEIASAIRGWYQEHPVIDARSLPPGIRRRLARGKPLPPGIAKKVAPQGLNERVALPAGYELVEAGLDVVLVEAATGIVHDILTDVIR